jgi:hypothetical protein
MPAVSDFLIRQEVVSSSIKISAWLIFEIEKSFLPH